MFLQEELDSLKAQSLYRSLRDVSGLIDFSSNDYLGLSQHPRVIQETSKALKKWGTGSGASRLLSGNLEIHEELETKLAAFKKEKSALVFSSGYLANLGAVTALVGEGDLVITDRLNHASLIDAARLSRAKLWVYPHKDLAALQALLDRSSDFKKKLVMTDAYFSMDGDVAPLDKLHEICKKKNAMLMIDEAHSTGVFGKTGRGLTEHFNLSGKIPVVMGTLSKALGSVGGFVAGSESLKEILINRARSFIYTTAPSPAASAAALAGIQIIEKSDASRKKLWANIKMLREGLKSLDFNEMNSEGPVVPILIGDTQKTLKMQEFLRKKRIFTPAIRPPTVPKGTDRIRISLTAKHSKDEITALLLALKSAKENIL